MGGGASSGKRSTRTERPPEAPSGEDSDRLCTPIARDSGDWRWLKVLFAVHDPLNLGLGQDVEERGEYNAIEPVLGWKLQSRSEPIYQAAKQLVAGEMRTAGIPCPGVQTKLDAFAIPLGLDFEVNEKVLLHGTNPGNLSEIVHNGLTEKFSDGLFGKGMYFAEDVSKIDQYATSDEGDALGDFRGELYSDGIEHPGKVYYAIVCRVLLGFPVFTKDGETSLVDGQPVFASDAKRILSKVPAASGAPIRHHALVAMNGPRDEGFLLSRHREFVVFDSNRVLEQYVVAYERRLDPSLPRPCKQGLPPELLAEQDINEVTNEVTNEVRDECCGLETKDATGPILLARLDGKIDSYDNMTWELWVRVDQQCLCSGRIELLQVEGGFGIKFQNARAGEVVAYRWGGPERSVMLSALRADDWCKLHVVFGSDATVLYENGVEIGRNGPGGRTSGGTNRITLMSPFGQFGCNSTSPFPGTFGHVRSWNRALNEQDVQDCLSAGCAGELPERLRDVWWLVDARPDVQAPEHRLNGACWKQPDAPP